MPPRTAPPRPSRPRRFPARRARPRRPRGSRAWFLTTPVLAVAAVAAVTPGCGGGSGAASEGAGPPSPGTARMVRVVDGDTLIAAFGPVEERVRLIGIDTPETKKPDTPVECFGPEASARLGDLLPEGEPLRLERDIEERDRYGRLLAYVYRAADNLFVNEALVADGYAATATFPPNTAHRDDLDAAARGARLAGAGLWPRCGGAHRPAPGPAG
jgi:micrococcal nuclease